jgi:cyanuric acid amidohydrolase
MQTVEVIRIPTRGPGDTTGLAALLDSERLRAEDIVAVMGKTEGNGCVNDFAREYSAHALANLLARRLDAGPEEIERRVALVMSGGTEGVLSPHLTVFARRAGGTPLPGEKRLAVGVAFTRAFLPEELGRMTQVRETARAVRAAMDDAGLAAASDAHFVQIKCPLLTTEKIEDARRRGAATVVADAYESMGYSRGASALGVALAAGEVAETRFADESILSDWQLSSSVASTSAGVELENNVVIVMGMSARAASPYRIAHGVMRDAIDAEAVAGVLVALGLGAEDRDRVVNVFAKAEASPDGKVRGVRHTMLNDSDINATRHARAAVGAVVAAVVGHTAVYVSGGAEHQGPPGGGPVAAIARA